MDGRVRDYHNAGNGSKGQSSRNYIRRTKRLLMLVLLTVVLGTAAYWFYQGMFVTVLADSEIIYVKDDNMVTETDAEFNINGGMIPTDREDLSIEYSDKILTDEKIAAIKDSDTWKEILANEDLYPEALIKDLKRNPEILDFADGYLTADTEATGGLTLEERLKKYPLFIQWDERWGYAPYGENNIGISGCGPTCLSMVLYSLTRDKTLTPDVLAELAMDKGYYVSGSGTSWLFMTGIAPQYGVFAGELTSWTKDTVEQYLNDGKLIICSMRPGDFTDTGHFIVLIGSSDGKLLVNDPFSYTNSSKVWEYDTIDSQCKHMWYYEILSE